MSRCQLESTSSFSVFYVPAQDGFTGLTVWVLSGSRFCGSCNHGTSHSRITDEGDDHQIWRVAVNVENKRTSDKGWYSRGRKKHLVTKSWPGPPTLADNIRMGLGYGLDDWGSRVRYPAGARNFSLHHRVQNGSGAHPTSYPMGTGGSFPVSKAAGEWSWQLNSI
jgi:hypothetical protein